MPMNDISWQQVLTVLGLLGTAIAFMFSKQTIEAIITLGNWWGEARKARMEMDMLVAEKRAIIRRYDEDRLAKQKAMDEELNDRGYKLIAKNQDKRITDLEGEVKDWRESERQCRKALGEVSNELNDLKNRFDIIFPGLAELNVNDSKVRRYLERVINRSKEMTNREDRHKQDSEPESPPDSTHNEYQ